MKTVKRLFIGLTSICATCWILLSLPHPTPNDDHISHRNLSHISRRDDWSEPKTHIYFLKTHKCGSSTVQNIFLRYGYDHQLTFALPKKNNLLGFPIGFKHYMLDLQATPLHGYVDIFCLHTRLLPKVAYTKLLYNDTTWITILRHPSAQFDSNWSYFALENFYKMNLTSFVNLPMQKVIELGRRWNCIGINQMAYDLGMNPEGSEEETQEGIQYLDQLFDLVIILEHLDESLILMKHLLHWNTEDIAYYRKLTRPKERKVIRDDATSNAIVSKNSIDARLYQYFTEKHRALVQEFGLERMAKEVREVQELREQSRTYCEPVLHPEEFIDEPLAAKPNALQAHSDQWVFDYCRGLKLSELKFVEIIRTTQQLRISGGS